MVAQLCTSLIGSRNLSTTLLRIKDIGITILVHLAPVFAQVFYIIADFLFHLKEQTSLAHIFHLIPNGGKQTLHRLVKLIHQTFEQTLIARHRLRQHQIASGNQRTLGCIKIHLTITLLRTEPKAERSNLQGTRVYLATIDVILQYQLRHLTTEALTGMYLTIFLKQRRLMIPGIHIDILIYLVEIKTKVHGTTGRIKRKNLSRLLQLALLQRLTWATDHISALLLTDAALTTGHLIPDTTQGVISQETHHILRRKELVAHRHLSAVARLAAFFSHLSSLLQGVIVLEHPSQGFVLFPEIHGHSILLIKPGRKLTVVDEFQELHQCAFIREKKTERRRTVEDCRQFDAQFVEHAQQITAITLITACAHTLGNTVVSHESSRLIAPTNTLHNQVTLLAHAKSAKTVELGKSLFSHQLTYSLSLLVGIRIRIRQNSHQMLQAVAQHTGCMHNVSILTWQLLHTNGMAIRPDAIPLLQHFRYVLHQQVLGYRNKTFYYLLSVLRNHIVLFFQNS